jgi:hypothetical protein
LDARNRVARAKKEAVAQRRRIAKLERDYARLAGDYRGALNDRDDAGRRLLAANAAARVAATANVAARTARRAAAMGSLT